MKVRTDLKAGSDFELEADVLENDSFDLGEMGEMREVPFQGMFLPPADPTPVR